MKTRTGTEEEHEQHRTDGAGLSTTYLDTKDQSQIWRRLLVRSDSTIAQLHDTLQIVFGWSDEHLHQFLIRGKPYGIGRSGGISFDDNPHQVRLGDFHFRWKETWLYEYDLTDWWQHEDEGVNFEINLVEFC